MHADFAQLFDERNVDQTIELDLLRLVRGFVQRDALVLCALDGRTANVVAVVDIAEPAAIIGVLILIPAKKA